MSKTKDTPKLRRIKRWYDQIMRGPRPTKMELEMQFRGYIDQAELLIQRIDDGQPWEDFVQGIDGAPSGLLRRLSNNSAVNSPVKRNHVRNFSSGDRHGS